MLDEGCTGWEEIGDGKVLEEQIGMAELAGSWRTG